MISEEKFKEKLINKLNSIKLGWENGDLDKQRQKKADIVNHRLKIAIEIKDDTKHKINLPRKPGVIIVNGQDLTIMNARLNDAVRSANRKFKFYPDYRTILIFRTEFFEADIFRYALEGLHTFSLPRDKEEKLRYIGRKTKYSTHNRREIGCFILWTDDIYYFPNNLADQSRVLEKVQVEQIFGLEFKEAPKI